MFPIRIVEKIVQNARLDNNRYAIDVCNWWALTQEINDNKF